jgi:hypothetical protein
MTAMEIIKESEEQGFKAYQEVIKTLNTYIDGARNGDGKLSISNFYEHAHVVGSINGEISNVTPEKFKDAINSMGAAPNIQHTITWVDISGPAAAAKIDFFNWNGFRFTDFFVLYKQGDQWKISGKTYNSHSKN